jgi:hypothetical protein
MPFLIRFGRRRAIFRELTWRCGDPRFEAALNAKTQAWLNDEGFKAVSVFESDPESAVVAAFMKQTPGKVLAYFKPARQARRIRVRFFRSRQMSFEFPPPQKIERRPA